MANYTDEQWNEIVSGMSDEQKSGMRRMLIREGEMSGELETPDIGDKMAYGWSKVPYTLNKIAAWGEDQLTEWITEKGIKDQETKLEATKLNKDPEYYAIHEAQIKATHERWRNTYGTEMSDLKAETDKYSVEEYRNIFGTEYEEDVSTMIGTLGKFMADPTTLLPLGAGFKAGALIGGAVAAYDNTFHQLYEKGAVDEGELALVTTLGLAAGGIVAWGGKRASHWIKNKIDKGEKVTEKELREVLLLEDMRPDHTPFGKINETPSAGPFNVYPRGASSEIPYGPSPKAQEVKSLPAPQWEVHERMKTANMKAMAAAINRVVRKDNGSLDISQNPVLDALYKHERKLIDDEAELLSIRDAKDAAAKRKQMDADWKQHKLHMDDLKRAEKRQRDQFFKLSRAPKTPDKGYVAPWQKEIELNQKEMSRELAHIHDKTDDIATALNIHPRNINKALSGQGGYAEQVLLQHIAGALVGGAAGGAMGDDSLALLGAIAGGFSPVWLPKLFGGVGKLNETALSKEWRINNGWAQTITSPETYARAMGKVGGHFADLMHEAIRLKTMIQSKSLHSVGKFIQSIPQNELAHFVAVMQGVEKPKSNAVKEAAQKTKAMFDEYANLSLKYGVIDKAAHSKMLNSHYWPRIYNERYLESAEGHKAFVRMLTDVGFSSKEQADRIVRSLVRDPEGFHIPQFVLRKNKDGTVSHVLTKEVADKVMLQRAKVSTAKRSTHMDHKRKLHPEDEKVLNEFLLDDPLTVITEYGHDVATRLGFAKHFGANDEFIKKLADSDFAKDTATKPDADYLTNLYYTALGDSRSKQVAAQINLSEGTKQMLGSINAFETLKLSLAQVLNMSQATVNGITFASKHGGARAVRTYIKGFKDVMTKEGQDFASRSGAALETTIMNMITEQSSHATVLGVFGKSEFKGPMSFMNTFNNPSTFLKNTGFMGIEKFQRNLAANQGKALFEEAMENYQKVKRGEIVGARAAKIKQDSIDIAKGLGMKETHLNPSSPKATEEVFEIAGLEFSNRINHTNNFDRLPPWARGPYARVALKFKSFMFHQGAFIKDNVLAPAGQFIASGGKKGSLTPIAAYIGVGTPMGMSTDQIRRFLASDDREYTNTQEVLRGITAVGAAGLWLDTANTFVNNSYSGSAYSLMFGPAMSDLFGTARAARDVVMERSGNPAFEQAVKMTGGNYPGKRYLLDMFRDQSNSDVFGPSGG